MASMVLMVVESPEMPKEIRPHRVGHAFMDQRKTFGMDSRLPEFTKA